MQHDDAPWYFNHAKLPRACASGLFTIDYSTERLIKVNRTEHTTVRYILYKYYLYSMYRAVHLVKHKVQYLPGALR